MHNADTNINKLTYVDNISNIKSFSSYNQL